MAKQADHYLHADPWMVVEEGFTAERIAALGNKFMTGNGYMGYRGTLEEYTKEQLVAVNMAGLYDRVGTLWREPINAPNGLWIRLRTEDGTPLHPLTAAPLSHVQEIKLLNGVHRRETVYPLPDGTEVTFTVERFVSMDRRHVLAMRGSIRVSADCRLTLDTGIDADVWDINGPHLEDFRCDTEDGILSVRAVTQEQKVPIGAAEGFRWITGEPAGAGEVNANSTLVHRSYAIDCRADTVYRFFKVSAVYTGLDDASEPEFAAREECREALAEGWDALFAAQERIWAGLWELSDVRIDGDAEAQLALRYSMYQLLLAAPAGTDIGSIPARGLSGQVYKGAIFWDTEMFMLPFFLHTQPALARNLLLYRCRTLDGARRKAAEYGFEGAFFAWESQDTGDDACTLFNVTDVFTGRPMRTYFRDKQVHISADVAHGIWSYYRLTGDGSLFLDGGAETVLECARFFLSYSYYQPVKKRYEILDVTGPDEYHERVNNNAFTNYMVGQTLTIALDTVDFLKANHPKELASLLDKLDYRETLEAVRRMREELYLPVPDETGRIEQFDRYFTLEDVSLKELKSRQLHPNEYWGGGNGLATTTRILKQADTVLMLHLFKEQFSKDVIRANWEYYEPRTEHGSSLSACIYAMVAADIGLPDWGYPYFKKTASVDLTGESKTYVGDLYIGGTHPAANGGAWMAAIFGFAGLSWHDGVFRIQPALPSAWTSIQFAAHALGQRFDLTVSGSRVLIKSHEGNLREQEFVAGGKRVVCRPGESSVIELEEAGNDPKGAIFDLDGVIVDTAKYHYLAWRDLAAELGFAFTEEDNERLKGVSRMQSLDILLEIGNLAMEDSVKEELADRKNRQYVEYITRMDESELLPGAREYLTGLRSRGIKIALGSASKNAGLILERLNIAELFDAVVDGTKVAKAKPDPEVFLLAARELRLSPGECVVYEDALAGIQAAQAAGMRTVGIGQPRHLPGADRVVSGLHVLTEAGIFS